MRPLQASSGLVAALADGVGGDAGAEGRAAGRKAGTLAPGTGADAAATGAGEEAPWRRPAATAELTIRGAEAAETTEAAP